MSLAVAVVGAVEAESEPVASAARRPDIVMVVVDDAGFTDFGAYGSEIATPSIDRLASGGVVFSNFHASPMCSPSRAMLLTGVDAHTAGVGSLYEATPLRHRGRPGYEGSLRSDVTTIASRLRSAGYRTYLSGKWNLGHTASSLPSARGFDRTFALDATGADNFEKRSYLPIYDQPPWFADGQPTDLPDDFYSSEFLVDKMIEFFEDDREAGRDAPRFAYLAFQAIHIPLQAPREFIERYEGVYDRGWHWLRSERHRRAVERGLLPADAPPADTPAQRPWESLSDHEKAIFARSMAVNAAMLEAMDHHLGRFLAYLEESGRFEQTVFVVLSDNGPEAGDPLATPGFARWLESVGYRRDLETLGEKGSYVFIGPDFASATAAPLAYYKFHGGEGGVRVPLVVSGVGVESVGTTAAFGFITDLAPTVLELAGVSETTPAGQQPMTGRSLVPILRDLGKRVHPPGEAVAFETAGHAAVFRGDHKLVRIGAPAGDGQWRLYDLVRDPGETRDLAGDRKKLFAELLSEYEDYRQRVGVLEVPALYSPNRQLTINLFYDRARENLVWLLIVAVLTVALSGGILRWLWRKRLSRGSPGPWRSG